MLSQLQDSLAGMFDSDNLMSAGYTMGGGAHQVALDLSVDEPPGWEAPMSRIKRVRDFVVPTE